MRLIKNAFSVSSVKLAESDFGCLPEWNFKTEEKCNFKVYIKTFMATHGLITEAHFSGFPTGIGPDESLRAVRGMLGRSPPTFSHVE